VIRPFGEAAFLVELESAARAQALASSLGSAPVDGVAEVVPGLGSLLVEVDLSRANLDRVAAAVEARATEVVEVAIGGRLRTVPVVYGGEHGPDLGEVAELCGLPERDVVALHASVELRVLFLGFAPGFAYLGDLPDALHVPRLATPRVRTPAGSVAIAGPMSGIYPAPLPGGWRVVGRTPLTLFDPRRARPTYLEPGDRVRFAPIAPDEWDRHAAAAADWT